ncbi:MAG: hypothetical protein ABSB30_09560 [Terracidiphilus sp.]|jgi:hypothetical protein
MDSAEHGCNGEPECQSSLARTALNLPRNIANITSILLLLVFGITWGISIDRYPLFYVDDAFFNFPAIRAAHGEQFRYQVSRDAPYANEVWAYHGPLYPNLQTVTFKLFGVNQAASRLPGFVAGWLAVLFLTSFLIRRGYHFAPLIFTVLWIGDRATQELMYGRMDGLAFLCLAGAFIFTEKAWKSSSRKFAFLAGVLLGLACAFHPFTFAFGIAVSILIVARLRLSGLGSVVYGACLAVPIVLWCWHFDIRHALTQFFWCSHLQRSDSIHQALSTLITTLKWSRYWFLALLIFTILYLLPRAWQEILRMRAGIANDRQLHIIMVALFALAGLSCIFRTTVHPYYLIYFTAWPILGIAMLIEIHNKRALPFLALGILIWSSSCLWNLMRFRETILYHSQLSHKYILQVIQREVPPGVTIVTTPEIYILPAEAGYKLEVTPWFPEQSTVCRECYLLIKKKEYEHPIYVTSDEISSRQVLYSGPAFPHAGPLEYPVVILSPAN